MMRRRHFLGASATALAMPSLARAESSRVLKFIPQSDLTVLDPVWTTVYTARNHGFMVFDTLFGMDGNYKMHPQMLEGVLLEDDRKRWTLTLRDGLFFHDGEKVLARDCVASIRRYCARDALGAAMMAATDELSAVDDKTIVFRLKKPFRLLPYTMGKISTPICAMMPERLAKTDPFKQVTEMVGSGPFRFKADEQVSGARVVYERNTKYVPRQEPSESWTAGGKVAYFDRVEWITIPDEGTAAGALQVGEVDWWELPTDDLMPVLKKAPHVRVEIKDPNGTLGFLKINCLQPPFNNPAIRRALLGAVVQEDYVTAIAGTDPKMWNAKVGVFCPSSELASDVGMEVLTGKRDLEKVKRAIIEAGYKGEKVAMMVATDTHYRKAMGEVGVEMMRSAGLNVDYQAMDWGTAINRRENKGPVDKGGWSGLFSTLAGFDLQVPTGHAFRTNGEKAWFGWADSPKIEELRQAWVEEEDLAKQKQIAQDIQRQWWIDVPHIPIGQWFQPTAWRDSIEGIRTGFPVFWGVKPVG